MNKKLAVILAGIGVLVVFVLVQRWETGRKETDPIPSTEQVLAREEPKRLAQDANAGLVKEQMAGEGEAKESAVDDRRSINHRALLNTQSEISGILFSARAAKREPSISISQLRAWLHILYTDALYWRLSEQELDASEWNMIVAELEQPSAVIMPELLERSSPHLSEGYLRELQRLVGSLPEGIPSEHEAVAIARVINQLLRKRKRHSDVFYQVQLRELFIDQSIGLDEKIAAVRSLIPTQDITLQKYAAGFFTELLAEGSLTDMEKEKVQTLLDSIQRQ